jgi:hypothetical protein
MRLSASILILFFSIPGALRAQSTNVNFANFNGHFIGESISDFLRLEPEAQQEVDVCRQHPDRHSCNHIAGALDRGERAELSTTGSANFVLDGGRLVKLTMLVDDSFYNAAAALAAKFGNPSKDTVTSSQDGSGARWQNHEYVWDTPSAYITLYEDNNPSLQDRRPLLIVKSLAEHLLDNSDHGQKTQPATFATR